MTEFCTIYTTTDSAEEAEALARTLLEERLIACANVVPGVTSYYRWQGRVESDSELAVLFKTRRTLADAVVARLKAIHSYDVPCVTVWPIVAGEAAYLEWVAEETGAG